MKPYRARQFKPIFVSVIAVAFTALLFAAAGFARSAPRSDQTNESNQSGEGENASIFLPLLSRPLPPERWPKCSDHNPQEWHALENASVPCHYDHEHKDNPHPLDHIFGTQIYEWAGGSISYPWATPGENEVNYKHEAYGWLVFRDMPPDATRDDNVFIKNLRIQAHLDLNGHGAQTRLHSNYVELQICRKAAPQDCGIIRHGGHQDYGELRVDGNWVPLGDQDPVEYDGVQPPAVPEKDYDDKLASREHSETSNLVFWEGRFGNPEFGDNELPFSPLIYAGFNHNSRDAFSRVNPDDPSTVVLSGGDNNNSTHMLRSYVLRIRESFVNNGRVDFAGYTDRFGTKQNPDCSAPGPDCVPLIFENVPMHSGQSLFVYVPVELREYDISPPGTSWIEFPN